MKDIYLHGSLAEHYGDHYRMDVRDPREAVVAIASQVPGFRDTIQQGSWHIMRGPIDDQRALDEDGVTVALGQTQEMHIIPAAEGAGLGVLVGAALIGGAFLVPGAFLATGLSLALFTAGIGLAVGGAMQMLTSPPAANYDERETADERPSFLFDGPVNTSTQGLPVPLIYGRMRVGSVVVSAGLTAEDIPINGSGGSGDVDLVDMSNK